MANFDSRLLVDKAVFSNFSLIMATINPVTLSSIKMFEEVIPASAVPEDVLIDKPNILFMGIMTQKLVDQNAIDGFQLDEISTAGINTGKKFYVQVTNRESNYWCNNKTLLAAGKHEKSLFLIKKIPFKIYNKNEVHFFVLPGQGTVLVKQYIDSAFGVGLLRNQQHLTLTQAVARKLHSDCNVIYGVVTHVQKEPTVTRIGNFHGMLFITDPSCCEVLPSSQKPEFCLHVFLDSEDTFPRMFNGDVLKLENITTQPRLNNPLETEFLLSNWNPRNQLTVFPNGDWEEPFGPYDRFYLTDRDIEVVEKLKRWYRNPSNYVDHPVLPQPPPPAILEQILVPDIQPSADENGPSTSQASYGETNGESSLSQEDKVNLDCPSNGLSSQTQCSNASVPSDQSIDALRTLLPTLPLEGQQRIILGLQYLIETASQMVTAHSSAHFPTQELELPSTHRESFVVQDTVPPPAENIADPQIQLPVPKQEVVQPLPFIKEEMIPSEYSPPTDENFGTDSQLPLQEVDHPLPTVKEEFVPTDEPMNEFPLHEESEAVSLASLNPASTENASETIPIQELVQPLSTNIQMEQESVSMEDSSLPEEDASMPESLSPLCVPAPPIPAINMETLPSDVSSQPFDANDKAVSQKLVLPPQTLKMENDPEKGSMNEVLPSDGSAETSQLLNETQELALPSAKIKEEFGSSEQPADLTESNDKAISSSLTTKIKIEITGEPNQSSSEEEALISSSDNSSEKQQSPLKNALEDDSTPQVSNKRIKIEPIESGEPFVTEMISRSSQ